MFCLLLLHSVFKMLTLGLIPSTGDPTSGGAEECHRVYRASGIYLVCWVILCWVQLLGPIKEANLLTEKLPFRHIARLCCLAYSQLRCHWKSPGHKVHLPVKRGSWLYKRWRHTVRIPASKEQLLLWDTEREPLKCTDTAAQRVICLTGHRGVTLIGKIDSKRSHSPRRPRGNEAFEVSQIKGRASSLDRGGGQTEGYLNNCRSTWAPREEARLPLGAALVY